MRRLAPLALAALIALPLPALAVGDDDSAPPRPTPTSRCPDGQVWDDRSARCVPADRSQLGDDRLYQAVRELAYAGRYDSALQVLAAMSNQSDSRVLTYRGFIARQQGDMAAARRHYEAAIAADPGNHLARSYYGMGLAASGDRAGAEAQLAAIRAGGGSGTWAETALAEVLRGGRAYTY